MIRKITLADIAREAGVSKQTVSRVINDNPDVAIATRKRVQDIIDRLDYQPNVLARKLSARQTHTIGLISSRLHHIGPRSSFVAIDRDADAVGYRVLPYFLHTDEPVNIEMHIRTLMAHQPDAIIWDVSRTWDEPVRIEDPNLLSKIPIITMEYNLLGVPTVLDVGQQEAARQIVHHLFDEGYKHIGIISGPSHWQVAKRRMAGWREALSDRSVSFDERQIAFGDWSAESGVKGIAQLLEQYPEMDAVFACNDQMALGALSILNERGICIPDEMGVVGYDDMPESAFFWPPLTTVHQPFDTYGSILVRKAIEMIESNVRYGTFEAPEMTVIHPEIIIRQSTRRRS